MTKKESPYRRVIADSEHGLTDHYTRSAAQFGSNPLIPEIVRTSIWDRCVILPIVLPNHIWHEFAIITDPNGFQIIYTDSVGDKLSYWILPGCVYLRMVWYTNLTLVDIFDDIRSKFMSYKEQTTHRTTLGLAVITIHIHIHNNATSYLHTSKQITYSMSNTQK